MDIRLKRIYDDPSKHDGTRILVERLWPRGVKKEDAKIDQWLKDVAPSKELRKWYGHDPAKWEAFREKYRDELKAKPEAVAQLKDGAADDRTTFVFAAKDEAHNSAVVLKEALEAGEI